MNHDSRPRRGALRSWALLMGLLSSLCWTDRSIAQSPPGPPGAQGREGTSATREVSGEVLVILGSQRTGEFDPALSSIGALRQPPFSAFQTMELLSRPSIRLAVDVPMDVPLPNGRVLRIVLAAVTPEGRYRVRVSINRPDQADYLPLLEVVAPPGDPFFLAGQSFLGGTLVIGVRLGQRGPASAAPTR